MDYTIYFNYNLLNRQKGRLKVKEEVYVGFEKMRDAFFGLFKGENSGKAIIKVVNTQTNYP